MPPKSPPLHFPAAIHFDACPETILDQSCQDHLSQRRRLPAASSPRSGTLQSHKADRLTPRVMARPSRENANASALVLPVLPRWPITSPLFTRLPTFTATVPVFKLCVQCKVPVPHVDHDVISGKRIHRYALQSPARHLFVHSVGSFDHRPVRRRIHRHAEERIAAQADRSARKIGAHLHSRARSRSQIAVRCRASHQTPAPPAVRADLFAATVNHNPARPS